MSYCDLNYDDLNEVVQVTGVLYNDQHIELPFKSVRFINLDSSWWISPRCYG